MDDLGPRLLELLGEPACRELLGVLELLGDRGCVELLAVLELPEPDRAALIGRLYAREQALAEVLADVEADSDDLVRLRLIGALREVLDGRAAASAHHLVQAVRRYDSSERVQGT